MKLSLTRNFIERRQREKQEDEIKKTNAAHNREVNATSQPCKVTMRHDINDVGGTHEQ